MFVVSLVVAAYLGFALIHLPHDKVVHFVTFGVLTAEFYWLWRLPVNVVRVATVLVCTLTAAVMSEVVQGLINPQRVFDAGDIYANVTGSLTGLACSEGVRLINQRRIRQCDGNYDLA